jgi:ribosomal protein S27AE
MTMTNPFQGIIDGLYEVQAKKIEQEECHQCGALHQPSIYVGRGRWFCSEAHFDEWMQWGRYERDER